MSAGRFLLSDGNILLPSRGVPLHASEAHFSLGRVQTGVCVRLGRREELELSAHHPLRLPGASRKTTRSNA